ncbi:MAG: DUF951 domain-containing protein [Bacilli bacterium]|nr:DUF951 domain-containing protein [Bacilli bacterium]
METKEYTLGDKILLKKKHPCGGYEWEIIRLGADIKIKCTTCGRSLFIPRIDLNKKIKKIVTDGE